MARIIPLTRTRAENADNPFWISFADLMTALVMLFLVVLSISMVAISSKDLVAKKAREVAIEDVLHKLDEQAKEQGVPISVNHNSHVIRFGGQAQFPFDSYRLSTQAITDLQRFLPLLLVTQMSESGEKWLKRIHIEGYTDETGSYLYNVNLSLKRAQSVLCAFFQKSMPEATVRQLQKLLIIDGATTTSIRATHEESRRVEVRLEFYRLGEKRLNIDAPQMPLGDCAIKIELPLTTQ